MKKILLTSIAVAGCCVGAFGQGTIDFINDDSVTGNGITLNTSSGPNSGSGLVVELLYNGGSGFVVEDTFTSTYTGSGNAANSAGYFTASPLTVTIPVAGTETFEVAAFYTSGNTEYSGTTASFTAIVRASPLPGTSDDTPGNSSWNGDLTLLPVVVPEPATIALGGLGAAALLLFRRRK